MSVPDPFSRRDPCRRGIAVPPGDSDAKTLPPSL